MITIQYLTFNTPTGIPNMAFKKKKIPNKTVKTRYTSKKKYTKKKISGSITKKFVIYSILLALFFGLLASLILYQKYLKDLPDIEELQNLDIAEASTIYDAEGNELYKIFKEKRTYIDYDQISQNMVHGIVAGEDQRYWENPGVDVLGLFRAVFNKITGRADRIKGTSTITQQLIRNTIIVKREWETFWQWVERKIQEVYLAYKLTNGLSKEKILELYLNKISFWSNAYGIEQAALTFFDVPASDVNIFQSSVLASLPKGPTFYSPYNHPDRVVGYPYFFSQNDPDNITKIINEKDVETYSEALTPLTEFIHSIKWNPLAGTDKILLCGLNETLFKNPIAIDNDGCGIFTYAKLLWFLNSIQINIGNNSIEYQTGRKDFILGRMLEDEYISFEEYKSALLQWIGYKFTRGKENITHPHFVIYVKEYLEEKYGQEIVSVGGLQIYTTLDPDLQEKAEELVEQYSAINATRFDAENAALISIDNRNGNIISMVGGKDYFDEEISGNVNMTTAKLQPGSAFKPFVYALWIFNNKIGSKTPIYDVETSFPPDYVPANFDGEFSGKMNISTALNNSRNIPAIKMFYLAGWERSIVNFMSKIGVNSLKNDGQYGAPLALWTGEMSPLELATAYSTFANLWVKKEISPIIKIIDSKGNIIEDRSEEINNGEQVISRVQTYITNSILSDTNTRPVGWNSFLWLWDRPVAAKTGTSTKQYIRNGEKDIFPRNLWTAGYTPQITTVVWAGNNDGKQLNYEWNGLEWAGSIWNGYMEYAHRWLPIANWQKPSGVKEVTISEVSGFLPSPEYVSKLTVSSLFMNIPEQYDSSFRQVEVDALCNGAVSAYTPDAAKRLVTLVQLRSLSPSNPRWEDPVQEWIRSPEWADIYSNIPNTITQISSEICEREQILPGEIVLKSTIAEWEEFTLWENYIEFAYKSTNPIKQVDILVENNIIDIVSLNNKTQWAYIGSINIPPEYVWQSIDLTLRAVDVGYYSSEDTHTISIVWKDVKAPEIVMRNPLDNSITIYDTDFFNLRAEIRDRSELQYIKVHLNGAEVFTTDSRTFVYPVNQNRDLTVWEHLIEIETIDEYGNESSKIIDVEVIKK